MDNTVQMIKTLIESSKGGDNFKSFTSEEIEQLAEKLGMDELSFINWMINITTTFYKSKNIWGENDSIATKLGALIQYLDNQKTRVLSMSGFKQLSSLLNITQQELLQRIVNCLLMEFETCVDQANQINDLKNQIYSLKQKNKMLLYKLQENQPVKNLQTTLVKDGLTPAKTGKAQIEIINRLKAMNLSDKEIAARLGVSRSTLWRRRQEANQNKNKSSIPF